jgi:hypothetical protein
MHCICASAIFNVDILYCMLLCVWACCCYERLVDLCFRYHCPLVGGSLLERELIGELNMISEIFQIYASSINV